MLKKRNDALIVVTVNRMKQPLIHMGRKTMKRRIRRNFTLIELLAVMLLMGALTLMMLPAFNQIIRGNKVDQMTAELALGLEQAQARAVSSRRHVALVLPNQQNLWSGSDEKEAIFPYSYGGFRLAYVEPSGSNWKFIRWVPDSEWRNAPSGAMLVRVIGENENDFDSIAEGDAVSGCVSNPQSGTLGNKLGTLVNCKLIPTASASMTIPDSLIVFSPYGGLKNDEDLQLVIAEAIPVGNSVAYPSASGSGGPTNWLMLSINKFTGRVEYYPVVK